MSKKSEQLDDLDDDYNDLYTSDAKESAISPGRGIGLDLSMMAKAEYLDDCPHLIQEMPITVVFDLPDGSQGENTFKLGNTVEVLKSSVESDYGIPMAEQDLFLEDRLMMNPLSLLDFPEAKGVDELYVRVEGPMPACAKK